MSRRRNAINARVRQLKARIEQWRQEGYDVSELDDLLRDYMATSPQSSRFWTKGLATKAIFTLIVVSILALLGIILVYGDFLPQGDSSITSTPTPVSTIVATPFPSPAATPAATPTPLPTVIMTCEEARDAIQDALDAYHAEYGEWPTADGQPRDIEWTKLVPDFMDAVPVNDSKCDWQVNSDPEGEVCVQHTC